MDNDSKIELESFRNALIDKIIYKEKHSLKKVNQFISQLSLKEKKQLEVLVKEHVKLDMDIKNDKISVWVETHYESASEHLESLIGQLREDIFPLFQAKGNAPFTILRNTLTFCDYISRLRFGKKGSSGDMSELFNSFGSYEYIRERYAEYKSYLIQLYRHVIIILIKYFY